MQSCWYTLSIHLPTGLRMYQGVTKRCRLSLLTNSALVIQKSQCGRVGGGCGVLANIWRSSSIFSLVLFSFEVLVEPGLAGEPGVPGAGGAPVPHHPGRPARHPARPPGLLFCSRTRPVIHTLQQSTVRMTSRRTYRFSAFCFFKGIVQPSMVSSGPVCLIHSYFHTSIFYWKKMAIFPCRFHTLHQTLIHSMCRGTQILFQQVFC